MSEAKGVPVNFTEWFVGDDVPDDDDRWRCHGMSMGDDAWCWTLDVWRESRRSRRWTWDVSCELDCMAPYGYRMGHASTDDDAMQAAEAACGQMDVERLTVTAGGSLPLRDGLGQHDGSWIAPGATT